MKKAFLGLIWSSKIVFAIGFFLFSFFSYVAISYVLVGHEIVSGGAFGSDAWTFITRLKLLSEYFPKYPFWNPWEGGGVSLTYSYPILVHTIIIATSRLVGWSLVEAFKFWEFAYVPIFAFGVFLFAWIRLRIKVVAFLAGLFFIISPIAWMWPFEWGFIAEAIAAMFFPYTILFFDLFLLNALDRNFSVKTRIYLLLTVIFLGLSVLSHPFVFVGVMGFMLVYGFLVAILRKKEKLKALSIFFISLGVSFILTILLFSFWLIPFYQYTGLATSSSTRANAGPPKSPSDWDMVDLTFTHVLSVDPPRFVSDTDYFKENETLKEGDYLDGKTVLEKGYIWRNLSFPLGVSILFFLGIITSFVLWRQKLPHLLASSLVLLLISVSAPIAYYISRLGYFFSKIPVVGVVVGQVLGWIVGWRGNMFSARLMVPIGAAFGAYGIFALFTYPLKFLDKYRLLRAIKSLTLSVLCLLIAAFTLNYFRSKPVLFYPHLSYGKEVSIPGRATYLRNIWGVVTFEEKCFRNIIKDPECAKLKFPSGFSVNKILNRRENLCEAPEARSNPICNNEVLNAHFDGARILDECNNKGGASICSGNFTKEDISNWVVSCEKKQEPFPSIGLCDAYSEVNDVLLSDLSFANVKAKLSEFPGKEFGASETGWNNLLSKIPDDTFIRYDISPFYAGLSQRGPYLKKVPQLSIYMGNISLIERLWGYQLSSFYVADPVYSDKEAIPQLAKYFGLSYVVAGGEREGVADKLENGGYLTQIGEEPLYEFTDDEGLVTHSTKPSILVIGPEARRSYEIVFKLAPYGLISYDKAILIKGKELIDSYTLEELKKFNVLFLYGYSYKSKTRAWNLIDQYLKEGGRVFIDTGWQFASADWDIGETGEFFPTRQLKWTNFGKTSNYELHGDLINTEGIETSGFQPLVWGDDPWGISSGENLRSWARAILTTSGHPLVAGGNYGKGKIVWSGMNLIGHIRVFKHDDPETVFASRLMDWLVDDINFSNFVFREDFNGVRLDPDNVKFTFNKDVSEPSYLYFKEAAHPYWRAELVSGGRKVLLPIYKAGPGFIYIYLARVNSGDEIILSISLPYKGLPYWGVSLITLTFLLTFIVSSKIVTAPLRVISSKLKRSKIAIEKVSSGLDEEKDY